jgi:hypothetical protein
MVGRHILHCPYRHEEPHGRNCRPWQGCQKLNTKSSTEVELVGVDDVMPLILWTRYFWTLRVKALQKTRSSRTTRAQSFLRKMGDNPVVAALVISTYNIFLSPIGFNQRNWPWNTALQVRCWPICSLSFSRGVSSIVSVLSSWTFHLDLSRLWATGNRFSGANRVPDSTH